MLSLDMNRQGNSPLLIVVIVLVIAAAGAGIYLLQRNSSPEADLPTPSSAMQEDKMMENEDSMEQDAMAESDAKYVQYQKAGYEQIADTRHVLFFYANWCPTCQPVDRELQAEMDNLPLTVVRVNYNDDQTDSDEEALADELGITYQHTYVLIENGEVVTRWNGGGVDRLLSELN